MPRIHRRPAGEVQRNAEEAAAEAAEKRAERGEHARELAEQQDEFAETKETANKARERVTGKGEEEEGGEEEQPVEPEQLEQASDYDDGSDENAGDDESSDDTSDPSDDEGADDQPDEDAGNNYEENDESESSTAPSVPEHDLPSRKGILSHLHEVRKETLETMLRNWYQTDGKWDITAVATFSAIIGGGQITTAALMNAYMKTFGAEAVAVVDEHITERPGVTKEREYSRPFNEYQYLREVKDLDHQDAMAGAALRLEQLVTTDIQLAKTKTAHAIMKADAASGNTITVTHSRKRYRHKYIRVIGSDKPCDLCLLASTQVYYHEDLMPIHPGCECDVEPLADDEDPKDIWIPKSYLDGPKSPEGSTPDQDSEDDGGERRKRRGGNAQRADDIRYYLQHIANQYDKAYEHPPDSVEIKNLDDLIQVKHHGEIGPILTRTGQHFRGVDDLPEKPSTTLTPMQAPKPTAAQVRKATVPSPSSAGPLTQDEADKQIDQMISQWQRDNNKGPAAVPRATDPLWKKVREIRNRVDAFKGKTPPPEPVPAIPNTKGRKAKDTAMNPFVNGLGPDKPDTSGINDPKIRALADKVFADKAKQAQADYEFVESKGIEAASVSQIQNYLPLKHPGLKRVDGFDLKTIDPEAAKEVLTAMDQMMTKYPDVHIGLLQVEDYSEREGDVIATTYPDMFTANRTERIGFNRKFLTKTGKQNFIDVAQRSEVIGHFFPGFSEKPWGNTIIHEFGHVMDNHGGLRARTTVNADALKLFRKTHKGRQTEKTYREWELNGFPKDGDHPRVSAYSMSDGRLPGTLANGDPQYPVYTGNTLNNVEALAQAFEEVESRGEAASDLSKVLHDRLIEFYNADPVSGQEWTQNNYFHEPTNPIQALKTRVDEAKDRAAQRLSDVKAQADKGSVTLNYVRNNAGVRKFADPNAFGQDVEPWGRYMSDAGKGTDPKSLQPGWEAGTVTFKHPLYIDDNDGQWKQKLSAMYDGATGKALSDKLLADGYDGVIPRDKYGTVEVVDIRPKAQRGHKVTATYQEPKANLELPEDAAEKDPLSKLLDDPKAKKDQDVQDIMDMLGVTDTPKVEPKVVEPPEDPIEGVPVGQEKYYKHLMTVEDTTNQPDVVMMNVSDLNKFREYDREGDEVDVVAKAIADSNNTIKTPISLQYTDTGAMVDEGNHRLAAAKKLGIKKIPVRLRKVDKIYPNDVTSRGETAFSESSKTLIDKTLARVEENKLKAAEKAKGFGLVRSRIADGEEIKPVYAKNKDGTPKLAARMVEDPDTGKDVAVLDDKGKPVMDPVVDVKASWDAISDETLKENWRKAIRGSLPWAQEAGKVWYPEVNRWAGYMVGKYGKVFEDRWGIPLTEDLMASFIASYSENNSWAGNLLGIRKFLDGTGSITGETKESLKEFDINVARKEKFLNKKTGLKYDFHAAKALRAMQNPEGGVADLRKYADESPKPADFAANIAGDYSKATADRWVARIMMHTNDYGFADAMWQGKRTVNKVVDRYGYKRLSAALQAVADEPEFAYLGNAAAVQAVPWVQVVGPMGSIGYIEDLFNTASIQAETIKRAKEFGEVK